MSSAWPALAQGISALAKGDGTILLLLADLYLDRHADGSYGNAIEAFDVISCVDEERTTDPAAIADGAARELAAAPYRDSGRGVVAARDKCAFWPVPPTSTPHTPHVAGLPPTVVVSTTGDPATPYAGGRRPGEGAGRHVVARRGRAARGGARRQLVRRRRRVGLPGRPHDPGERDRVPTRHPDLL